MYQRDRSTTGTELTRHWFISGVTKCMRRSPAEGRTDIDPPTQVSCDAKSKRQRQRRGRRKHPSKYQRAHAPTRALQSRASFHPQPLSRVLEKPSAEPIKVHVRDHTRYQHWQRSRVVLILERSIDPLHPRRALTRRDPEQVSRNGHRHDDHDDQRRRTQRQPGQRSPSMFLGAVPSNLCFASRRRHADQGDRRRATTPRFTRFVGGRIETNEPKRVSCVDASFHSRGRPGGLRDVVRSEDERGSRSSWVSVCLSVCESVIHRKTFYGEMTTPAASASQN